MSLKLVEKVRQESKAAATTVKALAVTVSVECPKCEGEQSVCISDYQDCESFKAFTEYEANCEHCENEFIFEISI